MKGGRCAIFVRMTKKKTTEFTITSVKSYREALVESRLAAGLSQQEVADEADINRSYVSRVENGEISVAYIERTLEMFRICGVTLTASFETNGEAE